MRKSLHQIIAALLIAVLVASSLRFSVLAADIPAPAETDEPPQTEIADGSQENHITDPADEEPSPELPEETSEQASDEGQELMPAENTEQAPEDNSEGVPSGEEPGGSEENSPEGTDAEAAGPETEETDEEKPADKTDIASYASSDSTSAAVVKYKVVFDGNGAESGSIPELELEYGKGKTLPANVFAKTGYLFAGWNTVQDGTGALYKNKAVVRNLIEENGGTVILYAQWKAITYTIAFNGKGKTSGTMSKMTKREYGQAYTLPENTFKKKGCTFLGWTTGKDGSGTEYADGAPVENLAVKNGATVTLYAKWYEEPYTIKYELNGGENDPQNPEIYTVSKSIKFKKPTKPGYTFKGWYKTEDFKKKVSGIAKGNTGDKIFYAKWALTQYKITYKLGGGKNSRANPGKYLCTTPTIVLEAPVKRGYDFCGWYTDAAFENRIEQISEGSSGNIVLYASWDPVVYLIGFDANGAAGSVPESSECKYGQSYKLPWPNLVKDGYVFKGWCKDAAGSGTKYLPGKTVKNLSLTKNDNVTLYAVWGKMSSTEESYAASVVTLVNKNREKNGCNPLTVNPTLSAVAQERAYEIASSFSHTRPDGSSCFDLFRTAGYVYGAAGENIAYGYSSPADVMKGWMNSTGHRANILEKSFTEIGVGCYKADGKIYWVQCFGTPR